MCSAHLICSNLNVDDLDPYHWQADLSFENGSYMSLKLNE